MSVYIVLGASVLDLLGRVVTGGVASSEVNNCTHDVQTEEESERETVPRKVVTCKVEKFTGCFENSCDV